MDDRAFWAIVIRAVMMILRAIDKKFDVGILCGRKPPMK